MLESFIRCPRIKKNFDVLNNIYPHYINKPIQPIGSLSSTICIVGLAPGLHGANRTGITFNGDFSGDIAPRSWRVQEGANSNAHQQMSQILIKNQNQNLVRGYCGPVTQHYATLGVICGQISVSVNQKHKISRFLILH